MTKLFAHPAHTPAPSVRNGYRAHFTAGVILAVILLATLAALAFTSLPAEAAPVTVSRALTSAPACEFEDGSGQRVCVWDGRHAGNGVGRSVVVRNGGTLRGTVTYVNHRRAHALVAAWEANH